MAKRTDSPGTPATVALEAAGIPFTPHAYEHDATTTNYGLEDDVTVTLPEHEGVSSYTLLWDSAVEDASESMTEHGPGSELTVAGASMQLFRAH